MPELIHFPHRYRNAQCCDPRLTESINVTTRMFSRDGERLVCYVKTETGMLHSMQTGKLETILGNIVLSPKRRLKHMRGSGRHVEQDT